MLPATHAGSWYPRGKPLTNMLTSAFETATVNESAKGKVKAIVVPHAGYEYCISTSTYAFKSIDPSNFNRCIIIGPSHRIYITHCTIADATTFETPYGEIPFDTQSAEHLTKEHPKLFKKLDIKTASAEHSLEMECPILKFLFDQKNKSFSVLPIMIGSINDKTAKEQGEKSLIDIQQFAEIFCNRIRATYMGREFLTSPNESEPKITNPPNAVIQKFVEFKR